MTFLLSAFLLFLLEIDHISCENELSIYPSVIKEMEIRQCFFVYKNAEGLDLHIEKTELLKVIPTAYVTSETLIKYIEKTEWSIPGIAIILKETNLDRVEEITQTLKMLNQTHKISRYKWLVLMTSSELILRPENLRIPYNCEFIIIQPETTSRYKLIEYYTTKNRSFIHDIGMWTHQNGLETTNVSLYWRRLNVNRTKITTYIFPIRAFCNDSRWKFERWCISAILIRDFSNMMNFENVIQPSLIRPYEETFIINFPRKWGFNDYNDSIKFYKIGPVFEVINNWYIKYPETILLSDYFIRPFHKNLWVAIILSIFAGTAFIIIISKQKPGKNQSIIENTFLIFESYCNQSSNEKMENTYLKMICFLSQIVAIIIAAYFGAVITSFVAVEILQVPFTNLHEFVQNGQYKLRLNGDLYQVIEDYKNIGLHIPRHLFVRPNLRATTDDAIYKRICNNEKIVLHVEGFYFENNLDYYASLAKVKCDVYRITKPIDSDKMRLNIEKFSTFRDAFNHNLVRVYEYGIKMKYQQMLDNKPTDREKPQNSFKSVELRQTEIVLLLPLIGTILAILIVMVEILHRNRNKIRKQVLKIRISTKGLMLKLLKFKKIAQNRNPL